MSEILDIVSDIFLFKDKEFYPDETVKRLDIDDENAEQLYGEKGQEDIDLNFRHKIEDEDICEDDTESFIRHKLYIDRALDRYPIDDTIDYQKNDVFIPFDQIIGVGELKSLLADVIASPKNNPSKFYGLTTPNKFLSVHGVTGCGINTTVQAFAARHSITLIRVSPTATINGMMKPIIQEAIKQAPSIIFFDRCDKFFCKGTKDGVLSGEFVHQYNKNVTSEHQIWTLFSFSCRRGQIFEDILEKIDINTIDVEPPDDLQRLALFCRFLHSRYQLECGRKTLTKKKRLNYGNFNEKEFNQLVYGLMNDSKFATAGMIRTYLAKVFLSTSSEKGIFGTYNSSKHELLPSLQHFESKILKIGKDRIIDNRTLTHQREVINQRNWKTSSNTVTPPHPAQNIFNKRKKPPSKLKSPSFNNSIIRDRNKEMEEIFDFVSKKHKKNE